MLDTLFFELQELHSKLLNELTFSFSSEIFASKHLPSELSVFKKVVNFEEIELLTNIYINLLDFSAGNIESTSFLQGKQTH